MLIVGLGLSACKAGPAQTPAGADALDTAADRAPEVASDGASDVPSDGAAETGPEAGPEIGVEAASEVRSESRPDAAADAIADASNIDALDAGESGRTDVGGDIGTGADTRVPPYAGLPQPMCVWNEAYQENYAADTIPEILAGASGCYVLIDPFASASARSAIGQMKQNGNLVSCYISVGTCEDWRDDFAAMQPYCVSAQWGDWPGEYFVDRTDPALVALMEARVDKMAAWGCSMVEFDNMDWTFDPAYRSQYGITATASQGETYNQALCAYVHAQGMGCMAKSSARGASNFDGLTVESSPGDMDWWESADMQGMLSSDKIGIVVHYDESDCDAVRATYQAEYGTKLSFICEDRLLKKYRHFP